MNAVDLAGQRLAHLWLGKAGNSAIDVVRHLTAVQAQVWTAAELTVRARATELTRTDIAGALAQRDLVVSWLNRGTLHLVTREDFWLLQNATASARKQTLRTRFRADKVAQADAEETAARVAEGLSETPMTKAALVERMAIDRFDIAANRRTIFAANVLEWLSAIGVLVRTPLADAEPGYVSTAEWLGPEPSLDERDILPNLAHRYAQAHWPATADDFAAWLGIGLTAARAAWAEAGLMSVRTHPAAPAWTGLLGAFDAALHGWPDRTWLLGSTVSRIISTNGVFRPSIIVENRCVGTWRFEHGRVQLDAFEPTPATARSKIDRDVAAIEAFSAASERPTTVSGERAGPVRRPR